MASVLAIIEQSIDVKLALDTSLNSVVVSVNAGFDYGA